MYTIISMADAESRQGTHICSNDRAVLLDFCRREHRPLRQEMLTQLCFRKHNVYGVDHTPPCRALATRKDRLKA